MKVHSNDTARRRWVEGEAHGPQRLEDLVADRTDGRLLDFGQSLRLDRTVHCSTPRLTPACSSTPRFGYLPMPKASWKAPSRGVAMARTFSVHDRSDWATVAKVCGIWWVKVSSAGVSGERRKAPPRQSRPWREQHRAADIDSPIARDRHKR